MEFEIRFIGNISIKLCLQISVSYRRRSLQSDNRRNLFILCTIVWKSGKINIVSDIWESIKPLSIDFNYCCQFNWHVALPQLKVKQIEISRNIPLYLHCTTHKETFHSHQISQKKKRNFIFSSKYSRLLFDSRPGRKDATLAIKYVVQWNGVKKKSCVPSSHWDENVRSKRALE